MKKVQRIVYQCDHCKKLRFTRDGMKRHEERCAKNPKSIQNLLDQGVRWL